MRTAEEIEKEREALVEQLQEQGDAASADIVEIGSAIDVLAWVLGETETAPSEVPAQPSP